MWLDDITRADAWPMHLTVGAVLTAAYVAYAVAARPSPPPQPPVKIATAQPGARFTERWGSVSVREISRGKPVQVERITSTTPTVPETTEPVRGVEPPPPTERPKPTTVERKVVAADICAKHNMRKVWEGKRWRCRK